MSRLSMTKCAGLIVATAMVAAGCVPKEGLQQDGASMDVRGSSSGSGGGTGSRGNDAGGSGGGGAADAGVVVVGSGGTGGLAAGGGSMGASSGMGGRGGTQSQTGGQVGAGGTGGRGGNGGSARGSGGAGGSVRGTGGGTSTGGAGTGGTGTGGANTGGPVVQPPPITSGGMNGWASRYWDCCKPACGWPANVGGGTPMTSCNQQNQSLGGDYEARNSCESGGTAFMCWTGAPWSVSNTLSYGFAAASSGNYRCGRCYQLQFTGGGHNGTNAGVSSLNGKTMIVQVINNGGVAGDQLDILIPGGGVGALNACTRQWATSDLGSQYGGFLTGCNGDTNCVRQKCQTVFAGKPDLQAGCDWFLGWYGAADNPNLTFKQIACPAAITQRSGLRDPG